MFMVFKISINLPAEKFKEKKIKIQPHDEIFVNQILPMFA